MSGDPNKYPPGWTRERVGEVLEHYENQSEDEAAAELEAALAADHATMEVPHDLVPTVRDLIAKHKQAS